MPSVVLTGATSGVGLQAAVALAKQGFDLILPVRAPDNRNYVSERLSSVSAARVAFVDCDLASMRHVVRASAQIRSIVAKQFGSPAALIMNAGIYPAGGLRFSVDGFELTLAVNVLGHFLLYQELSALLKPGARVVTVGAEAHRNKESLLGQSGPIIDQPSALLTASPESLKNLGRWSKHAAVRYSTSKLFCIQMAYEINRRARKSGVAAMAFDPGTVTNTNISRGYPFPLRTAYQVAAPVLEFAGSSRSAEQAGQELAWLATSADAATLAGKYISHGRAAMSSAESYNINSAEALWKACVRATSPFLSDLARKSS